MTDDKPEVPRIDDRAATAQAQVLALSIAKEAAGAARRARTCFLNNMSHELRSPLSDIIGLTELALGRATDTRQAQQLSKVQCAAEQLLTLVTDMLDLTALQSRQLSLARTPFQLGAVLDSLHRRSAGEAKDKGLELTFDTPAGLREWVLQGDPLRLEQVLLALTGNAIKFTARGRVAVQLILMGQTQAEVVLRVEVQDSGIGIAVVDQKRIFGLFEQLDDSSTRRYSGTGLGLALSKQLVELMGGSMGVDSQIGVGSVFWFTVRLSRLAASP